MGQERGEKWTAAAKLQPTLPKSDRLLGALDEEATVDVMLDLGPWLLLRWSPTLARCRRRWVSVPASEAQPNLHALRAAVYCRRSEPTPGTRSARSSRQAAEPD